MTDATVLGADAREPQTMNALIVASATPTIPLNKLKFGDDKPGGSINARTLQADDIAGITDI